MNRQRLLWVILSLTALVIIILGAGLLLLRNTPTKPLTALTENSSRPLDPLSFYNEDAPLFNERRVEEETGQKADEKIEEQEVVIGESPDAETEKVFQKQAETATEKPSPRPDVTPQPKATTPPAVTRVKESRQVSEAPKDPTVKKPVVQYWIQTGSYKSKSLAESCNALLIENGLSGRIVSKVIDYATFFRVRIGPYPNKKEAEKFLSWIKNIEGMEQSYISR